MLEKLRARLAPESYVLLHFAIGLTIAIACLLIFSALTEDVTTREPITQFDTELANFLHAHETPFADVIFLGISLLGNQILIALIVVLAGYYLWRHQWLHLTMWLAAVSGGLLLNAVLKLSFQRARPFFSNALFTAPDYSFPSGHAMNSFVAYGMLAYFLIMTCRTRNMRMLVIGAAIILVTLIGISRIYLGVHYFSDVVGGYAAGGVWLSTCITAMQLMRLGRLRSKNLPEDEPAPT